MKKYLYFLLIFLIIDKFAHTQCTKIGTYIGSFNSTFLTFVDLENPQVLRAIVSDKQISFILNNPIALNDFNAFLDSIKKRNIEFVLTIRFEYSDSLNKEDRIITNSDELDFVISNIQELLNISDNRITYLQVLNETFGVGSYTATIDSLTNIYSQLTAENMVLSWIDTISKRFKYLINSNNYSIELLSPSIQSKGLESVKNNQTSSWTYKLTLKIFEVTNLYCDALNFHWYPENYNTMYDLVLFSDTSSLLQINAPIYKTCTEWSQAHEVRNILQSNTNYWNSLLQTHCESNDSSLTTEYLALINDSLDINHYYTYEMYQLMNQYNYKFASYFAMVQDHYMCGEMNGVWYALCDLYATRFTANNIPNGNFYNQFQNIKEFIYSNCTNNITEKGIESRNTIQVFPNPSYSNITIEWKMSNPNNYSHVFLYDTYGNLVFEKQNLKTNKISFSTSKFNCGIYYLKILDNSNNYRGFEKIEIK
ncbi:MAG: T9SS type A sorting domain-containing protein [Flavobacteriia bacterium]|nr:T9SS type A sorting domain-containing protein [Flavobacteriia bacterium]